MHKIILAVMGTLFCVSNAFSQDIIHLKDGQDIEAKIIEMDSEKIRYKKFTYQEGMDIVLSISKIASITYANGQSETFDTADPASVTTSANSENPSAILDSLPAETPKVESPVVQTAQEVAPVEEPKNVETATAATPAPIVQEATSDDEEVIQIVRKKKSKKIPPQENPESVWYQTPNNGFSIWVQPLGIVQWGPMIGFSVRHKTLFMIDGYVRVPLGYAYSIAANDPDNMSGFAFGVEAKALHATRSGAWYVGPVIDIGMTKALYNEGEYSEEDYRWFTFIAAISGGYRFCFGRHFHMDLGVESGILWVSDQDWRKSNKRNDYYSSSYDRVDKGFVSMFGMFVLSLGVEF